MFDAEKTAAAVAEWIKEQFLKDKSTEQMFVKQLKSSFNNYRNEFNY